VLFQPRGYGNFCGKPHYTDILVLFAGRPETVTDSGWKLRRTAALLYDDWKTSSAERRTGGAGETP
jgi:hypothetical protein